MSHPFTEVFSQELADPVLDGLGKFRVIATSSQYFGHNVPVRAWIGAQELDGVTVDQFGMGLKGYVQNKPDANDTLQVQIGSSAKFDTGLKPEEEPGNV